MECVFCAIASGLAPSHQVYADEHAIAFMDINPAVPGHVLVIPRRHAADLFALREQDAGPYLAAVVRVAKRVRAALEPDGMNLFQSSGTAAWQSVFHLHVHVLPRRHGDRILMPGMAGPGDPAELARLAATIRAVE